MGDIRKAEGKVLVAQGCGNLHVDMSGLPDLLERSSSG
jgi:hypothetical protein